MKKEGQSCQIDEVQKKQKVLPVKPENKIFSETFLSEEMAIIGQLHLVTKLWLRARERSSRSFLVRLLMCASSFCSRPSFPPPSPPPKSGYAPSSRTRGRGGGGRREREKGGETHVPEQPTSQPKERGKGKRQKAAGKKEN